MLPSLMRQISSVPQSFGNGRLNPVSEGFNVTKVMTLGRKERRSSMGQVHSPWMVQPRSPVANMPRNQDVQLTTTCHEFSCGCTARQCEPGQSKGPAAHQHPGDFPVPLAKRNFPPAFMCICRLFLRLQEENPFLHKLPLLVKSPTLVRVIVAGNVVLSVKDMALVNQTRALSTWGT